MVRQLVLVVHDIRSTHNVGSLLRTADGLGVNKVIFSGYTPYPTMKKDSRLPHISQKLNRQIHKTALGAEVSVEWAATNNLTDLLQDYRKDGYIIVALEQTSSAISLSRYQPPDKLVIIVGSEVGGIDKQILETASTHLQIPMSGAKDSFNVAVAAAIALYYLRYSP